MAETKRQSLIRRLREVGSRGLNIPTLRESVTLRSLVAEGTVQETVLEDGLYTNYRLSEFAPTASDLSAAD